MTFLAPTGSQWRTPELNKSLIVSSCRGCTRVQAWPRKRGPARTIYDYNRRLIFTLTQLLIKRLHPRAIEYERQAIKEHNDAHRGQRGSAAIRLRDWQTQTIMGRSLCVHLTNGITFYPPAVHRDASQILDCATQDPGAILMRDQHFWNHNPTLKPGLALTAGSPGNPAQWAPL